MRTRKPAGNNRMFEKQQGQGKALSLLLFMKVINQRDRSPPAPCGRSDKHIPFAASKGPIALPANRWQVREYLRTRTTTAGIMKCSPILW